MPIQNRLLTSQIRVHSRNIAKKDMESAAAPGIVPIPTVLKSGYWQIAYRNLCVCWACRGPVEASSPKSWAVLDRCSPRRFYKTYSSRVRGKNLRDTLNVPSGEHFILLFRVSAKGTFPSYRFFFT